PTFTDAGGVLASDNGYGGLTMDGEYVVRVQGDALPPAPWSNVIANEQGGFLVTERGGDFSWAGSSYGYRLTPWHNDPVSDGLGTALYLQDAGSGLAWSPTPAPLHTAEPYRVVHGAGRSTFDHERDGIATVLTLAMAEHDPVRLSQLRVTNRGEHPRRLTLTVYAEWV